MAIEHSCHICACALSRVRAPLDPIYHLPVVVCPACGAACVRRRHPIAAAWRSARRSIATGVALGWRLFFCAIMVGFTIGICSMLSDSLNSISPLDMWRMSRDGELDSRWWENWDHESGPLTAGMGIAWSIAVGATLTAAFAHVRRRWVIWLLFVAAVAGVLLLDGAIRFVGRGMNIQNADMAIPPLGEIFWEFNRMSGWLLVGLLLAAAGVPLGRALRRSFAKGDGKRWRASLRRARKRRLAA